MSGARVASVYILGAGKVGRALARALRESNAEARTPVTVTLRSSRKGLPPKRIESDLLILAVRDAELRPVAQALADRGLVAKGTACVHVAGSQTAEAIAPLRAVSAGIAQMHPMISFASLRVVPTLARGNVHVKGDPIAEKRARVVTKRLGMTPRTFASLDTIGYHAAAGLVANGAAALAAVGTELLVRSGVSPEEATKMLGPLLRSVAENVEALGFPAALTGPVRRGDAGAVEKHAGVVRDRLPSALPLYLASARAQIPLARALGDGPASGLDAIEAFLAQAQEPTRAKG